MSMQPFVPDQIPDVYLLRDVLERNCTLCSANLLKDALTRGD